jgi:hypothetical protein
MTTTRESSARGLGGYSPANITYHLKGMDFPATTRDLFMQARENGAGREVLELIRSMPDRDFYNMADVMAMYGEAERRFRSEYGDDRGSRSDGNSGRSRGRSDRY